MREAGTGSPQPYSQRRREVGMEKDLAAWEAAASDLAWLVEDCKKKIAAQEMKTNKVAERVMEKYQAKVDRRRSGK